MENTDLQEYFVERFIELLHKDTLDSYRVKTHNVYSLIKELCGLIISWRKNQIKQFETIKLCIQEVREAVEKDDCLDFSFYSKNLFIQNLDDYSKSGEKDKVMSNRILILIEKSIEKNKEKYLPELFEHIKSIVFQKEDLADKDFIPTIEKLDFYVSALCCELLHRGFSKIHLYVYMVQNKKKDFTNLFDAMKDKFLSLKEKEFVVIFRLSIPQKILGTGYFDIIKPNVDKTYNVPNRYHKFIKSSTNTYFYVHKCKSLDSVSAIKIARGELAYILDTLHIGANKLSVEIPNTALVLSKNDAGSYVYERKTQYVLDGNYSNDIELSYKFKNKIDKIRETACVPQDVKDRIESALRHLRIGDANPELEQRFINYWIALEFIFSSAETDENTYSRLKTNLINTLTCCYVKRNLLMLNDILIKEKQIESGTNYWEKGDIDEFINGQKSPLRKYRLKGMKANLFSHSDKRKKFIKCHENHLIWHISRIYHMRNELIHEAAIKQNIENVTSNLRYYLVFVLNQIIVYFADITDNTNITLDHFFYEYEIHRKRIQENCDLNTLMSIPIELDLLK